MHTIEDPLLWSKYRTIWWYKCYICFRFLLPWLGIKFTSTLLTWSLILGVVPSIPVPGPKWMVAPLGSPVWLTDDWTRISFCFTSIYICTHDALSLANDTHLFATSLIISLCTCPKVGELSPKEYTQVRYFVRLQVALQKGCTSPSSHHQHLRQTDPGWPADGRRMTTQLIFSASG